METPKPYKDRHGNDAYELRKLSVANRFKLMFGQPLVPQPPAITMELYTVIDSTGTLATRAGASLVRRILRKQGPNTCTVANNDNPDEPMNGAEWLHDNTVTTYTIRNRKQIEVNTDPQRGKGKNGTLHQ